MGAVFVKSRTRSAVTWAKKVMDAPLLHLDAVGLVWLLGLQGQTFHPL